MIFFFSCMAEDCWIVGLHKKTPIHKSCAVQKSSNVATFRRVSLLKIARKFGIYWDAPPPTKSVPKLQIGITSTTSSKRNLGFAGWHWNPGSGNISTDSMILLAVSKAHWVGLALELRSVYGLSYMSALNYILRHILVHCVKALFQSWRWMENALYVFHFDLWGKLVDHQQENLINLYHIVGRFPQKWLRKRHRRWRASSDL